MNPEYSRAERFIDLYEVYFGPFPAEGRQVSIWSSFLREVPEDRLEELVTTIADERTNHNKKPRLDEFRAKWRAISFKRSGSAQAEACGLCAGTGFLDFPGRISADRPILDPASSYIFVIPCKCSEGQRKPAGFDADLQLEVFNFVKEGSPREAPEAPPWEDV